MSAKLIAKLKRVKNYRLGLLAVELARLILDATRNWKSLDRKLISLKPKAESRGRVLLCYENKGFFLRPGQRMPNDHTNRWESVEIARAFLEAGYEVDVISENNHWFMPAKQYSFFVGNRINFDRITAAINHDCIKILHIDTAHWLFNNTGEHQRLLALQQRRGSTLQTRRSLLPNLAIEHADCATILGNSFSASTYAYAGKPLYRIPISSPTLYPWPVDKQFDTYRKNYLWLGSYGLAHKGLDLVLEAFAEMPDYHLTVCGPIDEESDFKEAYEKELYRTPNIHTPGFVDVESPEFLEISRRSVALIYPSCSESGGGSVITCMHAGLIPIVSREASVDVDGFGFILEDSSIAAIKDSVRAVSNLNTEELKARSRKAWEHSRAHYTREIFAKEYRAAVSKIISLVDKNERSLAKNAVPSEHFASISPAARRQAR